MSTATSGRAREHKVRDDLMADEWVLVARSAGSKGAADLVMVHDWHGLALIQVGTDKKALGPAERARLCDLAELCSAIPLVALVTPRVGIAYYIADRGPASGWERWTP